MPPRKGLLLTRGLPAPSPPLPRSQSRKIDPSAGVRSLLASAAAPGGAGAVTSTRIDPAPWPSERKVPGPGSRAQPTRPHPPAAGQSRLNVTGPRPARGPKTGGAGPATNAPPGGYRAPCSLKLLREGVYQRWSAAVQSTCQPGQHSPSVLGEKGQHCPVARCPGALIGSSHQPKGQLEHTLIL